MMNNGLAIAVVVCLLLAASAGTSEASAALARDEMAAVHGGCLIGMCGTEGPCRDIACTSTPCSFKNGPTSEDRCQADKSDPAKECNLTVEDPAGCGSRYENGICIKGKCNNALDNLELNQPKYKRDEYTDGC